MAASSYPFQAVGQQEESQELVGGGSRPKPTTPLGNPFNFGLFDREDDSLSTQGMFIFHRPKRKTNWSLVLIWSVLGTGVLLCIILSSVALGMAMGLKQTQQAPMGTTPGAAPPVTPQRALISKIAFGSCSSYDLRPQTVWTQGIIPSAPDAWIWVGDMAYLDDPVVSCNYAPSLCNCTLNFIRSSQGMCMAGNFSHGRERMAHQVNSAEYRTFLEYMCPGAAARGMSPPPGSDPSVCPKPILGVYDDHDFGWNNGNRRLPNKEAYKQLFLDAIGEPASSPRRSMTRGVQDSLILNEGMAGREVQVVLLDERYERDPLPCEMRRQWCQAMLAQTQAPPDPWCADFLLNDGQLGAGSCCFKDEQRTAWCGQAPSVAHPFYLALCDPASADFGSRPVALRLIGSNSSTGGGPDDVPGPGQTWELYDASLTSWQNTTLEQSMWRWLTQDSPFCDLFGPSQRQWLSDQLTHPLRADGQPANPALRLIVSGSVPFGSMGYNQYTPGLPPITCSGDDWSCYQPARLNLLHSLGNATGNGCVVILTGDYHYGDIKVVQPNSKQAYGTVLRTRDLKRPIYQLMSSGMSDSTAQGSKLGCLGTFAEDLMGLRPGGSCAYTPLPNFGMVRIDWDKQIVSLEVQDASGRGVAVSEDKQPLQLTLSLATCMPV